jgi:hypothetical protein
MSLMPREDKPKGVPVDEETDQDDSELEKKIEEKAEGFGARMEAWGERMEDRFEKVPFWGIGIPAGICTATLMLVLYWVLRYFDIFPWTIPLLGWVIIFEFMILWNILKVIRDRRRRRERRLERGRK